LGGLHNLTAYAQALLQAATNIVARGRHARLLQQIISISGCHPCIAAVCLFGTLQAAYGSQLPFPLSYIVPWSQRSEMKRLLGQIDGFKVTKTNLTALREPGGG
jgi:hypothetical protein